MGVWSEFKKAGRQMYGIPDGVSAAKFMATLPADCVRYVKGEAVSAAYQARRTRALQSVMDYQQMGGATREQIAKSRGEKLPTNYYLNRADAHRALEDFPEIAGWIDTNGIG